MSYAVSIVAFHVTLSSQKHGKRSPGALAASARRDNDADNVTDENKAELEAKTKRKTDSSPVRTYTRSCFLISLFSCVLEAKTGPPCCQGKGHDRQVDRGRCAPVSLLLFARVCSFGCWSVLFFGHAPRAALEILFVYYVGVSIQCRRRFAAFKEKAQNVPRQRAGVHGFMFLCRQIFAGVEERRPRRRRRRRHRREAHRRLGRRDTGTDTTTATTGLRDARHLMRLWSFDGVGFFCRSQTTIHRSANERDRRRTRRHGSFGLVF